MDVSQIPTDVLLVLVLLLLALFGLIAWRQRRQAAISPTAPPTARSRPVRLLIYLLKLGGFGLFSFLVIDLALTVYLSYQTVLEDIAPAPSQVEIPPGFQVPVQEITFAGGDNLTLAGWYVPPKNGAVIILLHGYGGNRQDMIWHAQQLYEAGYGLLLYDERASGESEGSQRTVGWRDPVDVGGAIRYLQSKPGVNVNQIGIVGCSIGGQIALQAAAAQPEIQAVWADGAAAVRARDLPPTNHPILFLTRPSNYLMDWLLAQKLDMSLPPAMIDLIGGIEETPITLVAGGTSHPLFGAEAQLQQRFAAFAGKNTEVWVIEEAYHCDGPAYRPDEYAERMVFFFDAAFADAAK